MTNILIAVVVILLVATLVQILRVSELLSEIKNKDVNEVTDEDNNTQGILFLILIPDVSLQYIDLITCRLLP